MTITTKSMLFDEVVAEGIGREIAAEFNVTLEQVRSKSKLEPLATARQVILALTPGHESEVAPFWNRERTTCLYSRRTVANRYETDLEFRKRIEKIMRRVGIFSPATLAPILAAQGGGK
jgi:chromosomal replication initiation ATPase DnaA